LNLRPAKGIEFGLGATSSMPRNGQPANFEINGSVGIKF
jgi:hypothetical protein